MKIKHLSKMAILSALTVCICNLAVSATSVAGAGNVGDVGNAAKPPPRQIAFMPDVHFHDIYAKFRDGSFTGIRNSISGKNATIRTMQAQLTSTRLFNENYFALLAALDDIVARGIKLVALPGDFSDDGQPIHIRGLREILDYYAKEHDIEFFAAPGNHDPVRPFDTPGGEPDFLGSGGHEQRIFSKGAEECAGYQTGWTKRDIGGPLKTICTEEVRHLGYQRIMAELAGFGFYPKASYLHWETPYSAHGEYEFSRALTQANYRNRQYQVCHQGSGGSYKRPGYSNCHKVPDASYLVEPVPGLWLLAIDANVYVPKATTAPDGSLDRDNFDGSGNAGYNKMLSHKAHVLDWIRDVVKRAEASGKQLIAFSHFPMAEFYDGQSGAIANLFGPDTFQLQRRPLESVSQVLADTGLKLHVGGHMHFNDTGLVRSPSGQVLINIQAPSLAAYVPAYKLMTLHPDNQVEVETVVLEEVPRFSELFEHYQLEYKALEQAGAEPLWNKAILQSQSYRAFTNWHIRELTRQRFLPKEWPEDLKQVLFAANGRDMLVVSQYLEMSDSGPSGRLNLARLKTTALWRDAESRARQRAGQAGLDLEKFATWTGFDLAVDFYRLRNAGQLALHDIGKERLAQYHLLTKLVVPQQQAGKNLQEPGQDLPVLFTDRFRQLLGILEAFQSSEPNDHFILDLASGDIRELP
jgi:3',5'-cyclic AMP phosphodiesterase CpdA